MQNTKEGKIRAPCSYLKEAWPRKQKNLAEIESNLQFLISRETARNPHELVRKQDVWYSLYVKDN